MTRSSWIVSCEALGPRRPGLRLDPGEVVWGSMPLGVRGLIVGRPLRFLRRATSSRWAATSRSSAVTRPNSSSTNCFRSAFDRPSRSGAGDMQRLNQNWRCAGIPIKVLARTFANVTAYASDIFRRCTMFKGRHFDRSVILLCVRWYLAYSLSLRDLEEMMAERGVSVDHTTIDRWTVHYAPLLLEQFNLRKHPVTGRGHVDETYIKVRGRWMYLYRA